MTQADSFSWEFPDGARIVALVHDSAERERSSTVVDAIATSIGKRREHTLVMSTEPGPTPLDELAGAGESDGWPVFFAERERLTQVAVQRPERPYVYLSAGRDARTVTQFLLDDIFLRFIDRVRERGGTLLLVMCERTPIARDLGKHLDGYVALGDIRRADSDEFDYYGRVRYGAADARPGDAPDAVEDAPEADEPVAATAATAAAAAAARAATEEARTLDKDDAAAPEPEVRPRRRVARRGPPLRLVVWVLVTAAVLAGGWWLYRNPDVIEGLRSRLGFGNVTAAVPSAGESAPAVLASDGSAARATEEPPASATEEPLVAATSPVTAPTSAHAAPDDEVANGEALAAGGSGVEAEASGARPGLDPASAGVAFETATERPYSVLVRSLGDGADARNHVAALRTAAPGVLYFTAPTPVEDILYHRVFAGALESEADAAALLDVLVRSGATDEANPWQLRRARLAFDLGVFAELSLAEARVAELAARDIPAYSLASSSGGHAAYRVYAGAYEDERAALAMTAMLEAAGEAAALVPRRGDQTPSTP